MTRHLTNDEIEYILDFFQPNKHIPYDSAQSIVEINKSRLRNQLTGQKVHVEIIPQLKRQIKKEYENSLIHAGESVGIVCAQSIGERQTQMSVAHNEKVLLKSGAEIISITIGEFVDLLVDNSKNVINTGESWIMPILNVKVLSIGKNQSLEWCDITEVSRHPPNGKMMTIVTESGRNVSTTLSHSHLCLSNGIVTPIMGSDIRIDDRIPIVENYLTPELTLNRIEYDGRAIDLTNKFGFFMGKYICVSQEINGKNIIDTKHTKFLCEFIEDTLKENATIVDDKLELQCSLFICNFLEQLCGRDKKSIPDFVFESNPKFITGFLSGFLSENIEHTFVSDNEDNIEGISLLLTYFGIYGNFKRLESGILSYVVDDLCNLFENKLSSHANVKWEKIVSIRYTLDHGQKYVYDFSVDKNETFALQSGILVHNTLNTFHKAGQSEKTVTMGVPRFQEILNATRDPKTVNCKVFFKSGNSTIQELRKTVGNGFVELNLGNLSSNIKICINKNKEPWYDTFSCLYNSRYKNYTNCLSIKLNLDMLYEYNLYIEDIAKIIETAYEDLTCVFSPLQSGQIDVFVDTSEISLPENRILFIDAKNSKEIYLEECVQPTLEKLVICGMQKVTNVYYCKEGEEWVVETDGSNFRKLLAHPCVDMTRTTSNNVWEIYETLGIEAAREFLIEELTGIMEGINMCHIKLLVERMTFTGTISSISRYTMRYEESGPLCRASFEESLENFLKAACRGEIEPTNGVSASIICGKRAGVGTGMVNIKVDIENLPKPKLIPEKQETRIAVNQNADDEPLVFEDSDDE